MRLKRSKNAEHLNTQLHTQAHTQPNAQLNLKRRPRRNRKSLAVRELLAETSLQVKNLIYPVFICDGKNISDPIKTMPGQSRQSLDVLLQKLPEYQSLGLRHLAIFPQIKESKKDKYGREALNSSGLLARCLQEIKLKAPEIMVISDVALDPYSSDGHDGVVENGKILNDITVEILCEMACRQASWGADWVAPSDMMDGRVGAIRKSLDQAGFTDTSILAYSAKYASSFYGPFRDALQSAPKSGDKKSYQMDFRNSREALLEAHLDIEEGADMVMVKPGLLYLDIIRQLKQSTEIPVAAYNVSGEYAMLKAAAQLGALHEEAAIIEMLYAFRRAGADAILTYFAPQAATILRKLRDSP